MSKIKKIKTTKTAKVTKKVLPKTAQVGRKRDETLEPQILEAAINILAEVGFDGMTMDMVAARVGAGKASLYRRWPSKPELVRDALIVMSKNSVNLDKLPDTGNVRDDLVSLIKPYSTEHSERKLRVLNNLGSFLSSHPKLQDEVLAAIHGPWTQMNRALMERAIVRGELSKKADIEMCCQIIVAMTSYYTLTKRKNFDRKIFTALLDNVLIPSMK